MVDGMRFFSISFFLQLYCGCPLTIETARWEFRTGGTRSSSPVLGPDGTIFISSHIRSREHRLFAVSPIGKGRWDMQFFGTRVSAPSVDSRGDVYISVDSVLYAISHSGAERWRFDMGNPQEMLIATPVVGPDGTVFVGSTSQFLYAVHPDGTQRWKQNCGMLHSAPAVSFQDGMVYIGTDDGHLHAISADGMTQWVFPAGGSIQSSPVVGLDGTVYVGSRDGCVYAIGQNGVLLWRYKTERDVVISPVLDSQGFIYVASGSIYAIHPDGTLKWVFNTRVGSSLHHEVFWQSKVVVGANDDVYCASQSGNLYSLSIDGKQRWRFAGVDDRASPVVSQHGTVYASSDRFLLAVELPHCSNYARLNLAHCVHGTIRTNRAGRCHCDCDHEQGYMWLGERCSFRDPCDASLDDCPQGSVCKVVIHHGKHTRRCDSSRKSKGDSPTTAVLTLAWIVVCCCYACNYIKKERRPLCRPIKRELLHVQMSLNSRCQNIVTVHDDDHEDTAGDDWSGVNTPPILDVPSLHEDCRRYDPDEVDVTPEGICSTGKVLWPKINRPGYGLE